MSERISIKNIVLILCVIFCMAGNLASADSFKEPKSREEFTTLLQLPLTDDALASFLRRPAADVKKWSPCYKAFREYRLRLEVWQGWLHKLREEKKFFGSEYEKIDFSLPEESGFGDDPENEFFNPKGRFRAVPVPQKIIDALTTRPDTKLVFNLRRELVGVESTEFMSPPQELPPGYLTKLTAILPNFIPACPGAQGWKEGDFIVKDQPIAPDNQTVLIGDFADFTVTKDGKQRYYAEALQNRN